MSLALDRDALQDLTGYKIGAKQRAWLRDQLGIDPPMGPDGRPRITEEVVNQAMLARRPGAADTAPPTGKPNWTK
jgi:hypothetical protein